MALELSDLNIILFAKGSPHITELRDELTNSGIRIFNIISESQLENIIEIIPINGVILNISSTLKATGNEKLLLNKLEEIYPTIRVRWNSNEGKIDSMYPDEAVSNINDFINKKCLKFDPRVIRTSDRSSATLNVLISKSRSSLDASERACTLNASDTGLFVITTSTEWSVNQDLFITINELTNKTPIKGTVVRAIRWGEEPMSTPGISIRFDSILDKQQDELFTLLKQ